MLTYYAGLGPLLNYLPVNYSGQRPEEKHYGLGVPAIEKWSDINKVPVSLNLIYF